MDDSISAINPLLAGLNSASGATSEPKAKGQVGKNEFLTMLVTQLKNQDPLDPMKNEDFAVNLAQFSQLEQLISINDKINPSGSASDAASLAGYLGTEVTLNSDITQVKNGEGDKLRLNLQSDIQNLKVELLGPNGIVKQTLNLGDLQAGRQTINLTGLNVANGNYAVRVSGQGAQGEVSIQPSIVGRVTGFIPGPDGSLLVGDREVQLDEIVEVSVAE